MAAPTLIQQSPAAGSLHETGSNTSEDVPGTAGSFPANVSANSTLIAIVGQHDAAARILSVADSSDAYATDWTEAAGTYDGSAGDRQTRIFYRTGFSAAAITVRIKSNFNIWKQVKVVEISESTLDIASAKAGVLDDVDATNGYPCSADTTLIDTAADVFVVSGVTTDATAVLDGGIGGFTELGELDERNFYQYNTYASAQSDLRGWVGESGTNRDYAGAIASFKAPASGITGTGSPTEGADTSAGTGAVTVTGTGTPAEAVDVSAGTGAVEVTGTGAPQETADTSAGTGIVGVVTGTGAATEGADVSAGTAAIPVPEAPVSAEPLYQGGAAVGEREVRRRRRARVRKPPEVELVITSADEQDLRDLLEVLDALEALELSEAA